MPRRSQGLGPERLDALNSLMGRGGRRTGLFSLVAPLEQGLATPAAGLLSRP